MCRAFLSEMMWVAIFQCSIPYSVHQVIHRHRAGPAVVIPGTIAWRPAHNIALQCHNSAQPSKALNITCPIQQQPFPIPKGTLASLVLRAPSARLSVMQRMNLIQTVHEAQRTHLGLLQCRDVLGVMGDCGELLKFWPPHPTACFSCASPCQDPPCLYGPLQDGSYKDKHKT